MRFTFDPQRLLARIRTAIRQQPLIRSDLSIEQRTDVSVVVSPKLTGLVRLSDGFAFVSPLAQPLQTYAIRASVQTSYAGSGWENQRVISSA